MNALNMYAGWPQQWPVWQQPQGIAGVRFVRGIEEARSVAIPCGTKALFMDADSDVFFIKETDAAGASSVDAYKFEKMAPEQTGYVTRAEFEEMKRAYESAIRGGAAPQPGGEQPFGQQIGQQPNGAAAGPYPLDQPAAGKGAGAAPHQGARHHAGGVGRDGETGV